MNYCLLSKKDIDASKLGIKYAKMTLKYNIRPFKKIWPFRYKYKKSTIKEYISNIRALKMTINTLYKNIPVPLYIEKDTYIINGDYYPLSNIRCPIYQHKFINKYDESGLCFRCPDYGQSLWWNFPEDDFVRYENNCFDYIHRRLK